MNQKEQEIISHLRKDARVSLAAISQKIEMPVSTVHDKLNRLQKEGVIVKHTALVDFSKLGFNHRVKLALKIEPLQKKDFLIFLQHHSNINSVYEIDSG